MITVNVNNIEVVQSIQNAINEDYVEPNSCMDNTPTSGVPVIAEKTTFARVYFDDFDPQTDIEAEGELEVVYSDGNVQQTETISSLGIVSRHEGSSPELINQRLNWNLSLNFRLPEHMTLFPEIKRFRLASLTDKLTGDPIQIGDAPEHLSHVKFHEHRELTCRALIFRYRDVENDTYLEPTREEVNAIRDLVEKSFPVAWIDWSVIRVEAQREFFALDQARHYEREHDETATRMLTGLLRRIMVHRNQELKAGFSTKTYYIGVFSDPEGRFGSVAVDAPQFPMPHVVAACAIDPAGEDGAHEIGHLLGRSHPGVPLLEVHGHEIGQYRIDNYALTHMGKAGHLTPPDRTGEANQYIGLDTDSGGLRPAVLGPTDYFDLMSYRSPRWPSAYTYRELYKRLDCTGSEADFTCEADKHWTVICSFDINQKTGQILNVLPTNYRTPAVPAGYASLEQSIVARAVDQLQSQLDWLIENEDDALSKKVWRFLENSIPEFTLKPPPLTDDDALPYTVTNYNAFMGEAVVKLVEDEVIEYEKLLLLLESNNIADELYEPDIRIFPNYATDGVSPCHEEDKDHMWENGIRVYYRRVGSKDRFPFGLLQATVAGKAGTSEPPTSLTLMIDRIIVDKYAQSFEAEAEASAIADVIFNLSDCVFGNDCSQVNTFPVGNGGNCEDRPPSNSLVYDVVRDGYYLNFHWPMAVLRREPSEERAANITTTVQCMRTSNCVDDDVVDDKWETVMVTDRLRSQVWISPDLFEIDYDNGCPENRPSARKPRREIRSREQDRLVFRFSITVGFYEFFSETYNVSPTLVIPRREDRFRRADSEQECPDDFQYDDASSLAGEQTA